MPAWSASRGNSGDSRVSGASGRGAGRVSSIVGDAAASWIGGDATGGTVADAGADAGAVAGAAAGGAEGAGIADVATGSGGEADVGGDDGAEATVGGPAGAAGAPVTKPGSGRAAEAGVAGAAAATGRWPSRAPPTCGAEGTAGGTMSGAVET